MMSEEPPVQEGCARLAAAAEHPLTAGTYFE